MMSTTKQQDTAHTASSATTAKGWRRGAAVTLAGAALVAGAAVPAQAVGGFHTSANSVRVRADASAGSAQVGTIAATGTAIDIACQKQGETVSVAGFGTSNIWDSTSGGWISDLFVQETTYAQFDSRIPRCDAAQPTPTTGLPAGARSIGYNPYAARYSNQCTYYAEQRMFQATGRYMPVYGNAYQFAAQARAGGWTVGSTPAVSSVAVFPQGSFGSSVGHVGWVVEVSGGRVRMQDYNWNWVGARVTDHWVTPPSGTQYIYSDR